MKGFELCGWEAKDPERKRMLHRHTHGEANCKLNYLVSVPVKLLQRCCTRMHASDAAWNVPKGLQLSQSHSIAHQVENEL